MDRIGVRELRQHASRYLDRVRRGEAIEVTERGTPVARLVPVTRDRWHDLLASGAVQAPTARLLDVEAMLLRGRARLSDELARLRADER
jgi:prevent-host-death family protein